MNLLVALENKVAFCEIGGTPKDLPVRIFFAIFL